MLRMRAGYAVALILLSIVLLSVSASSITTRIKGDLQAKRPTPRVSTTPPVGTDNIVFSTDEKGIAVEITSKQYCDACHAAIDIGIVLLRRKLASPQAGRSVGGGAFEGRETLEWGNKDMVNDICNEGMSSFKPYLIMGCHRLLEKHHGDIWSPWLGHQESKALFADQRVLEHKLSFCRTTKACLADHGITSAAAPSLSSTKKRRGKCDSCLEVAGDLRTVLNRMLYTMPNPQRSPRIKAMATLYDAQYDGFVDRWCGSLSLRHFRPQALIEVCEEMLSDYDHSLKPLLQDGSALNVLFKDPLAWGEKICVEMTEKCTKDEVDKITQGWEDAADADYDVVEAQYMLQAELKHYKVYFDDLRDQYFYPDGNRSHNDSSHGNDIINNANNTNNDEDTQSQSQTQTQTTQVRTARVLSDIERAEYDEKVRELEAAMNQNAQIIELRERVLARQSQAAELNSKRRMWTLPESVYVSTRVGAMMTKDIERLRLQEEHLKAKEQFEKHLNTNTGNDPSTNSQSDVTVQIKDEL